MNVKVDPYEVDFLWRDLGLVVETDGWATHRSRAAFEVDRMRDAELNARGYDVLRFTY
jgi:very-short-patch-repair endonuclease